MHVVEFLAQDTVIAPYASLLAAQFKPAEAVENLRWLRKLGALGRYGYHDAVDFTAVRVPEGKRHAVVHNFMAHHHGMSIVAVANAVFEGRMRDRFHADSVIESAELLLQEKAPREIPAMPIRAETGERIKPEVLDERPDSRLVLDPLRSMRATNLMSNGHYHVMVSGTGTGYSRADEIAITRWNGDPTEDRTGTFLFLSDPENGDWWSATAEPKRMPGETTRALVSSVDIASTFVELAGGSFDSEGKSFLPVLKNPQLGHREWAAHRWALQRTEMLRQLTSHEDADGQSAAKPPGWTAEL